MANNQPRDLVTRAGAAAGHSSGCLGKFKLKGLHCLLFNPSLINSLNKYILILIIPTRKHGCCTKLGLHFRSISGIYLASDKRNKGWWDDGMVASSAEEDWKSVKQVLLTLLCLNSKYKES